ncbi:hypothetical protein [Candidatus Frankia nodulisporulans]|uniref:hypothetical protein n=1 Tax=Candidatus Frankia nodulisporulans TaxID=2060052 RepID=UPI001CDD5BC6|nr:hypothetical protein [Candidatus Frankia nodulisporulans]
MRPRPAAAPEVALTGDGGLGSSLRRGLGPGSVGAPRLVPVATEVSDGPGRPATEAEASAITAAVVNSPLVPRGEVKVSGIRTSTGAPDWAFAVLRVVGGRDPSIAVLRWDVSYGWVLDQVGSARLGCGVGGPVAARRPELTVVPPAGQAQRSGRPRREAAGPTRGVAR